MGYDETVYPGSADSLRRWLFLQLSALWEVRDRLVHYMPAAPGAATGEAAILAAWRDYLDREAAALRSGPG